MNTHATDPVALVAGLFFGLAGLAVLADQQWEDVDVTAFTAAGVMVIGLLLAGLIVVRFVREPGDPANAGENNDHSPEATRGPANAGENNDDNPEASRGPANAGEGNES